MRWDIVTLSLGYGINPNSIDSDIRHYQNLNFPDCEEILVVNDASEDVGSGGSALNALIRTAERLCYRRKFTVLTEAVLQDVNILIVLVSDAKAILNSNGEFTKRGNGYIFDTYLTNSIRNAGEIAARSSQKGLWIIGSDAYWNQSNLPDTINLSKNSITGFTFETSQLEGHGRYRKNEKNELIGMEFDGDVSGEQATEGQDNLLILGFLYLPLDIATSFLSLYNEFPVAATTYLGVDSNVTPLKLSIFFDFMLATCISKEEFIRSKLGTHGKVSENVMDRSNARKQIYKKLRGFKGRVEILEVTEFEYKKFPEPNRDYFDMLGLLERKSSDIERALRAELSAHQVLCLDKKNTMSIILTNMKERIMETDSPEKYLQTIFNASLTLSLASEGKGGLRNGPAKNPIFEKLMQGDDKKTYLLSIFDEILKNWIPDPSKMIRAARHLETAAQKFIHEMVDDICADKTLKLGESEESNVSSVKVTAPVRIDFFGGWLDTPPIFFSMENAAVVNMAVQLDGKNPISCTITQITQSYIELCQDGTSVLIKNDHDLLHMHDKPSETGALVCACIVALGFQSLSSLFETLRCTGLRIETKSDLPHGSGLGTSSIMACTILKSLCALGKVFDEKQNLEDQIVHTVLRVEQIMTTGGGWQDQCGAVFGGLKKCFYEKGNGILHQSIPLTPAVKETLEQRLLLVYTGKTRLAKNLLQEVIRNFFTCGETKEKLADMANSVDGFVRKIEKGDIAVELLEQYYTTKTFMTRCEPPIVTELLEKLKSKNMIEVGWCAGAGGGGFLYLWLTPLTPPSHVQQFLESTPQFSNMTCHTISIPLDSPITLELN